MFKESGWISECKEQDIKPTVLISDQSDCSASWSVDIRDYFLLQPCSGSLYDINAQNEGLVQRWLLFVSGPQWRCAVLLKRQHSTSLKGGPDLSATCSKAEEKVIRLLCTVRRVCKKKRKKWTWNASSFDSFNAKDITKSAVIKK